MRSEVAAKSLCFPPERDREPWPEAGGFFWLGDACTEVAPPRGEPRRAPQTFFLLDEVREEWSSDEGPEDSLRRDMKRVFGEADDALAAGMSGLRLDDGSVEELTRRAAALRLGARHRRKYAGRKTQAPKERRAVTPAVTSEGFRCGVCGGVFALKKTLQMHRKVCARG